MNDALNLARAGLLDYGTALDLTRYLENETDYLPWESTLVALAHVVLIWFKLFAAVAACIRKIKYPI